MGPTELRIVLAVGTLVLLDKPWVGVFGGRYLLFDVGALVAVAGILVTLVVATVRHTIDLYRAEPLKPR